ncbi:MAG: DUF6281 family protein [Thermoleophilia bacterium]
MRLVVLTVVVLLAAGCGGGTGEFERTQAAQPVSASPTGAALCGVVSTDGVAGVPVTFVPGERLGPAVVPGCSDDTTDGVRLAPDRSVELVAIDGVDPALAVAIEGDPTRAYLAPGADREAVLALLVSDAP